MKILSFDVGGTKIAYALVNSQGKLLSRVTTVSTPKTSSEITKVFQKAIAENEFDGFALATAGVVCNGQILFKPNNLPQGYNCIKFEQILNVPYIIENDANSAAWAEYQNGITKNTKHSVVLTLGTGVGCGIISEGILLRGKKGAVGEVPFSLGGCDLVNYAKEAGLNEKDCYEIYDLALKNNKKAQSAYSKWEEDLISAIVIINSLLDTEIIALSGSLAKIVNYSKVEQEVNKRMPRNKVKIKPAKYKNHAGIIGAALLLSAQEEK